MIWCLSKGTVRLKRKSLTGNRGARRNPRRHGRRMTARGDEVAARRGEIGTADVVTGREAATDLGTNRAIGGGIVVIGGDNELTK